MEIESNLQIISESASTVQSRMGVIAKKKKYNKQGSTFQNHKKPSTTAFAHISTFIDVRMMLKKSKPRRSRHIPLRDSECRIANEDEAVFAVRAESRTCRGRPYWKAGHSHSGKVPFSKMIVTEISFLRVLANRRTNVSLKFPFGPSPFGRPIQVCRDPAAAA
jgi:hypothetical protein